MNQNLKKTIYRIKVKIKTSFWLAVILCLLLIVAFILLVVFNSRELYLIFTALEALTLTLIFVIILFYLKGIYFPLNKIINVFSNRNGKTYGFLKNIEIISIDTKLTKKEDNYFKEVLIKDGDKQYYLYLSEYLKINLEENKKYDLVVLDNFIVGENEDEDI